LRSFIILHPSLLYSEICDSGKHGVSRWDLLGKYILNCANIASLVFHEGVKTIKVNIKTGSKSTLMTHIIVDINCWISGYVKEINKLKYIDKSVVTIKVTLKVRSS